MIDVKGLHTEWHYRGKCAAPEQDPRDWDLQRRAKDWQTLVRAAKACIGCPVIRECAIEAVETRAIGTIRAGLPCPENSWISRGNVRQRDLEAAARGDNPLMVAAYTSFTIERYRPAQDDLLELVAEHVTAWTLPPIQGPAAPLAADQGAAVV